MPRKPDRFERLVETELKGDTRDTMPIAEFRYLAELLLRRQHRAMVNLVKRMPRVPYLVSDSLMRSAVIETLKKYAK